MGYIAISRFYIKAWRVIVSVLKSENVDFLTDVFRKHNNMMKTLVLFLAPGHPSFTGST